MKKFLAVLIMATLFLIPQVYAEESCSYKDEADLREKASNIKADYEIKEEVISPGTSDTAPAIGYYFTISVTNITEEFYVEVTNNYNGDKKLLSYNEEDNGIATFDWKVSSKITDFTFKVYTTTGNKCNGIVLNTFHLITPRYNRFYEMCSYEFPDYSLCQKFVTFKEMDLNTFDKSLVAYRESLKKAEEEKEKKKTFIGKIASFVDNYKWVMLGVVVVTGAGTGTFLYFKKKKQRDLGL